MVSPPFQLRCLIADLETAGAFHLVLDTCTGGEVYNLIIRGGNEGGLDGIDVWGFNIVRFDFLSLDPPTSY